VHESTQLESVMSDCIATRKSKRRRKPRKVAADKGYSIPRVRDWFKEQRIKAVIPHKDNEKARWDERVKFDKETYKKRSAAEQCVGWLKEYRRIGTRFEKLAIHFMGMIQLAIIHRCLRKLFSDRA
jgi:transposase